MPSKHWTCLIATFLVLGGAGSSHAQEYSLLSAPPFGIEFDPERVHFERAPEPVYQCEGLAERRDLLFLFGKLHSGTAEYYLISGWVRVADSSGPAVFDSEADEGILAVISQQGCRDVGLGYALSSDRATRRVAEELGFSDQIVAALIDDAVERQMQVFGGRDSFLCQPAIAQTKSPWEPLLSKKLNELGKASQPCK